MVNRVIIETMETIDYQNERGLFNEITAVFKKIKSYEPSFVKTKNLKDELSQIEKIVKKYTNIGINLTIDTADYVNAWVYPPHIDKNHPLIVEAMRVYYSDADAIKLMKADKTNSLLGSVDRKKSYVSGAFSRLTMNVVITKGACAGKFGTIELQPDELAGLLLHEVGHVFTYFEYLGSIVTTNFVLQHAARNIINTNSIEAKYKIINTVDKTLDITVKEPDILIKSKDEQTVYTILLKEYAIGQQNELDSIHADMSAWEMLSDQFASRHGAGKSLVTGLDKMYRVSQYPEYDSANKHLVFQIISFLFFLVASVLTLGLVAVLLLLVINPYGQIYDSPKDRMLRLRRDAVNILKKKNLSSGHKELILDNIRTMDKIIACLTKKSDFITLFWKNVMPSGKKANSQLIFQQELETLVANDIFVKATELEVL